MMRVVKSIFFYICTIVLLNNCKERELVIPQSENTLDNEEIDLIAKPVDIEFLAEYDYGFTIKWPKMSEKIATIKVNFLDVDTVKKDTTYREFELTNFNKDTSFYVKKYDQYSFNVQAFDKDGKASRVAVIKAWNKDLYARQLLKEASITQYGKFIRMRWSNVLNKSLKLTIKNSLVNEVVNLEGLTGERFIPILDNSAPDLQLSLLDNETGLIGDRILSFRPHGINLPKAEKDKWTIYTDSPYNRDGWFHLAESFDGQYTLNNDLDGTGKLCAVAVDGATKLNADRRIRTLYFTFTPKRLNPNIADGLFNLSMRRPPAPYENILVQKITFVFKECNVGWDAYHAVLPDQLKVYGIKQDGTEVLIGAITDAKSRFFSYMPDDPSFIKSLSIDVPQTTYDGATFRGIKTEFMTNTLPNNNNNNDQGNNIGLGEVYVVGVKTSD